VSGAHGRNAAHHHHDQQHRAEHHGGHFGSAVRALPAQVKLVAALGYVLTIVATPREAFWAFALHAMIVLGIAAAIGMTPSSLARRLVVEVPFVAFAVLLPIVGRAPRLDVGLISLSQPGLWAAWNILVKGTLGVAVSALLTHTTSVVDLLAGLERLRMPTSLVMIASFMVRYGEVLRDESERMRVARLARGYDPRWFWQARAVATSAGSLFVRAYERGERVHLAMQSRGFTGRFPSSGRSDATTSQWFVAVALPIVGVTIATLAWSVR
jgi:cobalt/nickel transport system permease protein